MVRTWNTRNDDGTIEREAWLRGVHEGTVRYKGHDWEVIRSGNPLTKQQRERGLHPHILRRGHED